MPLTSSPPTEYFLPESRGTLKRWVVLAGEASAVFQAAIRESFAQARYINLQNLRKLKKDQHGVLGQSTIQTALHKCLPRQRMWGISDTVILDVHLATEADQHVATLNHVRDMPPSEDIVHNGGGVIGVTN